MPDPERNGSRSIKDLYMSDSWDGLMKIANDTVNAMQKQDCRTVVNLINRMATAADASLSEGDEERAFILYHRLFENGAKYRKNPSIDRKYFDAMAMGCMTRSLKMCEQLSHSLQRRYDLQQDLKRCQDDSLHSPQSAATGNDQPYAIQSDHSTETPQLKDEDETISCKSLFNYVKNPPPETSADPLLLVLDVRPAHEFQQSHIHRAPFVRPLVVVVNIAEEALCDVTSMSQLEKKLQPEQIRELKVRRSAGKIILMDNSSSERQKDMPLDLLYKLLWTFSRNNEKGSEPPVMLQGGFSEWIITYPMYVTNSAYVPTKKKPDSSEKWAADYPHDEDKVDTKQPALQKVNNDETNNLVNGHSHVSNDISDDEKRGQKSLTKSYPGSAQPVSIPTRTRPVVPDRSAKPNLPSSLPNAATNGTAAGLPDKVPDHVHLNRNVIDKAELLTDRMDKMTLDSDQRTNSITSPPSSRLKPDNDNETADSSRGSVLRNTNGLSSPAECSLGQVRTTNRTLSESKDSSGWKSGGGPGSLSRSYSSPNIAKIVEQNESSDRDIPAFDRGKKPKIEVYRRAEPKFREFNVIHGATDPGLTGLRNLGMTCYMSAIIQCLSNTKEFNEYFVRYQKHESDINRSSKFGSRGEVTEELAEVLKALWSGQFKSIAPRDLKNAVSTHMPAFVGCDQQDSHEFLTMLLDKLHNDLNHGQDVPPIQLAADLQIHIAIQKFWNNHLLRNHSLISDKFEGLLQSTLTCRHCLYESHTYETFTCLSLPIPSEHKCSLQDCLREEFTKTEKLETTWDCDRCKVRRIADRRIQLCHLPPILVLHLKRFSFDGIWRKKLNTSVDFPLESLDMRDFMSVHCVNQNTSTMYDLTGVVNHTGTLEGGHYTATCRNPGIGKWFKFDDTDVSDLTAADVRTQKSFAAGYVFFYSVRDQRRSMSVEKNGL